MGSAKVVTVETSLQEQHPTPAEQSFETTGYEDGGTRDIAEAIRNFIKWASVNWQIECSAAATLKSSCRQALHTNTGSLAYGYKPANKSSANQLGYSALASTKSGKIRKCIGQ